MRCLLENGNYNREPILSWGQAARQAGAVASFDNRLFEHFVINMVVTLEKRRLIARWHGAAWSIQLSRSRDQLPDLE
jgi:activator of HSP90 ATPase